VFSAWGCCFLVSFLDVSLSSLVSLASFILGGSSDGAVVVISIFFLWLGFYFLVSYQSFYSGRVGSRRGIDGVSRSFHSLSALFCVYFLHIMIRLPPSSGLLLRVKTQRN